MPIVRNHPAAYATVTLAATLALSGIAMSKPAPPSGAKLFAVHCSRCHGPGGRGDIGPDLRGTDLPVSDIKDTIKSGVPQEMPAFDAKLKSAQITALVRYVKALPAPKG